MGDVVIEYAKPLPRWRTWVRRGIKGLLLVLLLATGAWGWYWRTEIADHLAVWSWQRASVSYQLPPSTVIVEPDPATVKTLLASGLYVMTGDSATRNVRGQQQKVSAMKLLFGTGAEIFLHERISRGAGGGKRRLVVVTYAEKGGSDMRGFNTQVFEEGTLWKMPKSMMDQWNGIGGIPLNLVDFPPTRFFAGQPDPADASHFTIEYEQWGQRDTVDGWLEANDLVKYALRKRPIPPRVPPRQEANP